MSKLKRGENSHGASKKNKKAVNSKDKGVKKDVKKIVGVGEGVGPEKENSTLSDGVLDAFDEVAPVDSLLLEDETILPEEEEEDELDSGDYKPLDEW